MKIENGMIISCQDDGTYRGRIYIVDNGRRRWILSEKAASLYGINISDVVKIPKNEMDKIPLGSFIHEYPNFFSNSKTNLEARSFMAKDLTGYGIEFGAATEPSPIPLGCKIDYADIFFDTEGCKTSYHGEYVPIDYHTDICNCDGVKDASLDFIIHNHVIEHIANPVLSLETCFKKLKKGGILLFTVPDKTQTFDCHRTLTSIEHIIKDYKNPSIERDIDNFIDFSMLVQERPLNIADIEYINATIKEFSCGKKPDFHYHTFTPDSFRQLLDYIADNKIIEWSEVDVLDRLEKINSCEFYVRLIK